MTPDVFISHSSKDKETADAICLWLEDRGIRCWVAPRDIRPGENWPSAIMQAIRGAKIMVLVFSAHAQASPQIKREVERAVHFGATVIPVRIENLLPEDDLEYFLGTSHWLDAYQGPLERHLEALNRAVKGILQMPAPPRPKHPAVEVGLEPTAPPAPALESAPLVPATPAPISPPVVAPELKQRAAPPPPIAPVEPEPLLGTTMLHQNTMPGASPAGLSALREFEQEGSFTTTLAATSTNKIKVKIPDAFLSSGSRGTILRLVPVERLREGPSIELYFKTGNRFTLGRSPEADWIACFFPRNEKNDQRSRRLSKIHARLDFQDGHLQTHRAGGGAVHIGPLEIGHDPAGYKLREQDRLILAEDYALEIYFDISLQGTLQFLNGEAWRAGRIEFNPILLGAVRFGPLNSALAIRNSCWLFVDVGFGNARGGLLTAGAELAPQQGVFMTVGGCFWILNLVNNGKVSVNDHILPAREIVPLTHGDSVWLGAVRYRVEIGSPP